MATLLNTLFRRNNTGDPVCKTLDTAALNFVYSVLEDLQGVGCRIEKPTSDGGAGWRIVFDGFKTTDIKPPDSGMWIRPCADADVSSNGFDPASKTTSRVDDEYEYCGSSYTASACFRLFGFRKDNVSAAKVGEGDECGQRLLIKDFYSSNRILRYGSFREQVLSRVLVDTEIPETNHATFSWLSGASVATMTLRGWYDDNTVSLDHSDKMLFRQSGTLMTMLADNLFDIYESGIVDRVESIVNYGAGDMLDKVIYDWWYPMTILEQQSGILFGATERQTDREVWHWTPIGPGGDITLSGFDEKASAFDSLYSRYSSDLEMALGGTDTSTLSGLLVCAQESAKELALRLSSIAHAHSCAHSDLISTDYRVSGIADLIFGYAEDVSALEAIING